MKDFKGKTAFVTGAASGIGLAMARTFLDRGMNVMLADVEQAALDKAVHSLSNHGDRVASVLADVALGEAFTAAAERAIATFGKVHILANNAGVSRAGKIEDIPLADWDWVIGVNLYGTLHGMRMFVPHMRAHGEESHIISTASIAGVAPAALSGPYSATKSAIIGLSHVLRDELVGSNIGVSVLCPSWVKTNMVDNGRNRPARFGGAFDILKDPALAARNKLFMASAARGLDPLDAAALVMRAIEANEFYIFTDPAARDSVVARNDELMQACDAVAERLPRIGKAN